MNTHHQEIKALKEETKELYILLEKCTSLFFGLLEKIEEMKIQDELNKEDPQCPNTPSK